MYLHLYVLFSLYLYLYVQLFPLLFSGPYAVIKHNCFMLEDTSSAFASASTSASVAATACASASARTPSGTAAASF